MRFVIVRLLLSFFAAVAAGEQREALVTPSVALRTPTLIATLEPSQTFAMEDGFWLRKALENCRAKANENHADCIFALGFVRGLVSVAKAEERACIPSIAHNSEFGDVVEKYIDEHPVSQHDPAWLVVMDAIGKAYPCAKKKR